MQEGTGSTSRKQEGGRAKGRQEEGEDRKAGRKATAGRRRQEGEREGCHLGSAIVLFAFGVSKGRCDVRNRSREETEEKRRDLEERGLEGRGLEGRDAAPSFCRDAFACGYARRRGCARDWRTARGGAYALWRLGEEGALHRFLNLASQKYLRHKSTCVTKAACRVGACSAFCRNALEKCT